MNLNIFVQYLKELSEKIKKQDDDNRKKSLLSDFRGAVRMLRTIFPLQFNPDIVDKIMNFDF